MEQSPPHPDPRRRAACSGDLQRPNKRRLIPQLEQAVGRFSGWQEAGRLERSTRSCARTQAGGAQVQTRSRCHKLRATNRITPAPTCGRTRPASESGCREARITRRTPPSASRALDNEAHHVRPPRCGARLCGAAHPCPAVCRREARSRPSLAASTRATSQPGNHPALLARGGSQHRDRRPAWSPGSGCSTSTAMSATPACAPSNRRTASCRRPGNPITGTGRHHLVPVHRPDRQQRRPDRRWRSMCAAMAAT